MTARVELLIYQRVIAMLVKPLSAAGGMQFHARKWYIFHHSRDYFRRNKNMNAS